MASRRCSSTLAEARDRWSIEKLGRSIQSGNWAIIGGAEEVDAAYLMPMRTMVTPTVCLGFGGEFRVVFVSSST